MQQYVRDRDRIWARWMRAANVGDDIAYRRLLEALAPLLRQVVRRSFERVGFGNSDVEDVVQETLLAIHLKRQTWDEDEAARHLNRRDECARSGGPLPNLRRCGAGGLTSGFISASCCPQGFGPM